MTTALSRLESYQDTDAGEWWRALFTNHKLTRRLQNRDVEVLWTDVTGCHRLCRTKSPISQITSSRFVAEGYDEA